MANASTYAAPIAVTVAYMAMYYGFMVHLMQVKGRLRREHADRGEPFDRYFSQDRSLLAADRLQLNTLEHMPPFLALLWLNAVFVGITAASIAGGVYVAARLLYPFVIGGRLGRGIRSRVLYSTVIGYAVLAYYLGALVWALVSAT